MCIMAMFVLICVKFDLIKSVSNLPQDSLHIKRCMDETSWFWIGPAYMMLALGSCLGIVWVCVCVCVYIYIYNYLWYDKKNRAIWDVSLTRWWLNFCQECKDRLGFNLAAMEHLKVSVFVHRLLPIVFKMSCLAENINERKTNKWRADFQFDILATEGFKVWCTFSRCKIEVTRDSCTTFKTFRWKVRDKRRKR
jgi:hypothetical protein